MTHSKIISYLLFSYLLCFSAIGTTAVKNPDAKPPHTQNNLVTNDDRTLISPSDGAFQRALSLLKDPSDEDTTNFYEKMGNEPIWYFQGNLSRCGQIAVEVLKDAAIEGLNPHDYEPATTFGKHPENWIKAELALTKYFLEFIKHVRTGRIDPSRISREIKYKSPSTHPTELLLDAIHDTPTQCSKLRHMAPDIPQYTQLKEILAHYRTLAQDVTDWPNIKTSKRLKLGDKDPDVKYIRKILSILGDLDEEDTKSVLFDESVEKALKQFQLRNTLEPDGVLGAKTKDALNVPLEERIRKVIINMERLRWLPDELGDKYITVNVAGYEVQAYEDNVLKLTIPAIVGRPSRRTPLFFASLKNVIVNPSWGVPYNILVHDKLPKILNDPDYVRRSGFVVTDDSGIVIDPDEADWENEGRHYHLRQPPGKHNALGRIKFNIENPYTIYMHGTPEEKLFKKTARPFSSGCVRLKSPVDLAVWVLNDENKWSSQSINSAIKRGGTQVVNPETPINVYFIYQTIWKGNDDLIHTSDDPYRMDPKMEKIIISEEQ